MKYPSSPKPVGFHNQALPQRKKLKKKSFAWEYREYNGNSSDIKAEN